MSGGASASDELLRFIYDELHRIAARHMEGERGSHTLQPTALLNEAWVKLFEGRTSGYKDRIHFLAAAAGAMREILIDHARSRGREKRGGEWKRVELKGEPEAQVEKEVDLVALDQALEELSRLAPRHARIVECRYFADLSVSDTAESLGISERTVAREWRLAKAWLASALGPELRSRREAEGGALDVPVSDS
jgi:RNA polymerase sigma-70 factor (ECF subfamily)